MEFLKAFIEALVESMMKINYLNIVTTDHLFLEDTTKNTSIVIKESTIPLKDTSVEELKVSDIDDHLCCGVPEKINSTG